MFFVSLALALPAVSTILGWLLFGSIGTIAVGYAKLKEEWQPAILGVALMVYPYLFPSGWPFWTLGIVLTLLLVTPRRFLPW